MSMPKFELYALGDGDETVKLGEFATEVAVASEVRRRWPAAMGIVDPGEDIFDRVDTGCRVLFVFVDEATLSRWPASRPVAQVVMVCTPPELVATTGFDFRLWLPLELHEPMLKRFAQMLLAGGGQRN